MEASRLAALCKVKAKEAVISVPFLILKINVSTGPIEMNKGNFYSAFTALSEYEDD